MSCPLDVALFYWSRHGEKLGQSGWYQASGARWYFVYVDKMLMDADENEPGPFVRKRIWAAPASDRCISGSVVLPTDVEARPSPRGWAWHRLPKR